MQFEVRNAIANVTIEAVLAGHAAGVGTITAASVDTLTWKAPGSETAGTAVEIANGETKLLHDGGDGTLTICVSRTSAVDLAGAALILISGGQSSQDMLSAIEEAIVACANALRETVGDKTVQRETMENLRKFRQELKAELALVEDVPGGRIASADLRGNF